MAKHLTIKAPLLGLVVSIAVSKGDIVKAGDILLVLEVMKVQSNIVAPEAGKIIDVLIEPSELIEKDASLIRIDTSSSKELSTVSKPSISTSAKANTKSLFDDFATRVTKTLDSERVEAKQKRHYKGNRTARENLEDLCDGDTFIEYGQFAVAAQRQRKKYEELQTSTAADGILTGVGNINSKLFSNKNSKAAIIVNDYSVLAGTQGYYHHKKLDRMLAVAKRQKLPVIMYTEGGGGRPGDTDVTTVNSGLQCESFSSWAGLAGVVPRIAIANGYNFAGNAALFGIADITIATKNSWVGMAGPAMIAGGGLGEFKPKEIGPIETQSKNGVVDIVANDEVHATTLARECLAIFQGELDDWQCSDQSKISDCLPDNRRFAYQIRDVINIFADKGSFIELKQNFGGAIITGFIRLEGKAIGLLANDCNVLGGAIDVDAGEKAADFLNLCNQFSLPVVSLCDTPGFMVGPEHENQGAVRRLAKLFTAGAQLTVPMIAIVLRKCYGLGAQAMVGGSTRRPAFMAAWPIGEFGPMGLEGAVQLGFKKELDAEPNADKRNKLFEKLLAEAYARGQATEVAAVLEIDAVIDPSTTRTVIISALQSN